MWDEICQISKWKDWSNVWERIQKAVESLAESYAEIKIRIGLKSK